MFDKKRKTPIAKIKTLLKLKKKSNHHKSAMIGFVLGCVCLLVIFLIYPPLKRAHISNQNKKPHNIEIGYIEPNQILIFWKTETPTTGYIKIGNQEHRLLDKKQPISTNPSQIHTVVLDENTTEDIYISVHSDDAFYFWPPQAQKINLQTLKNDQK